MPEISLTGILVVAAVAFLVPLGLGILSSMRVPSVVLEILAGVLIGPAVLGLVEVDLPLEVLALIGLAFLLFLAGSEVDLERLRGGRLRGAATGFALSLVLALGVALALQGAGLIEAPLFVTIMLSATALGIVVPVLADAKVIAAIAHDLRTPLTAVLALIEAVADGVVEPGAAARYLRSSRRELVNLSRQGGLSLRWVLGSRLSRMRTL